MKFLVIGLGSMGKRRVRNLKALNQTDIAGFDSRKDRIEEVRKKYSIPTYSSFEEAIESFNPDALLISTSPESHMNYAFKALALRLPTFIEASVVEKERIEELSRQAIEEGVFFAPSCTMKYFQGPIEVKRLLEANIIGKPLYFTYHTGQSLVEWHPWEEPKDYYVSQRETGAAREIVPFELTWLCDTLGEAEILSGHRTKLSQVEADIDDIYTFNSKFKKYEGLIGNITVDVITPYQAARRLHIIGNSGQIIFNGNSNTIKYCTNEDKDWVEINLSKGDIESGYINPENPYIAEVNDFIQAITQKNSSLFPNSLQNDYQILTYLDEVERKCLI